MNRERLSFFIIAVLVLAVFWTTCNKNDDNPEEAIIGWAAGNAYDGFGTIYHTTDGGRSWHRQGDATMIPNADLTDIRAIDKDNAWAAGIARNGYPVILRTFDGGRTWIRQGSESLPSVNLAGICPVNEQACWAVGEEGAILKTTDGGSTWTYLKASPDYLGFYQMVAAADENHVWAVGEGDNLAMIHYTSDGGKSWERQGLDSLTTGNMPNALIDIHAADANYVWAVGPSQAIYTLDGGKTWHNKPTPIGFNHNNGVCIVDQHIVWVVSDYNQIFKLSGLEEDWISQASDAKPAMYMGISALDSNKAWITTNTYTAKGQILYTSDGGANWTLQATPGEVSLRRVTFVGAKR